MYAHWLKRRLGILLLFTKGIHNASGRLRQCYVIVAQTLPCLVQLIQANLATRMFRASRITVVRRAMSTSFSEIVALKGDPKTLAKRLPLAKIVATIGPASENLPMLSHVMNAGMRLMRINFSHAVSSLNGSNAISYSCQ